MRLGIQTGAMSGIVVLDAKGPDGIATLRRLEATNGKLPATATARTRGGFRYYFKYGCGYVRTGTIGRGLDMLADGRYVEVPPGARASGREHSYEPLAADDMSELAALPRWIKESA